MYKDDKCDRKVMKGTYRDVKLVLRLAKVVVFPLRAVLEAVQVSAVTRIPGACRRTKQSSSRRAAGTCRPSSHSRSSSITFVITVRIGWCVTSGRQPMALTVSYTMLFPDLSSALGSESHSRAPTEVTTCLKRIPSLRTRRKRAFARPHRNRICVVVHVRNRCSIHDVLRHRQV
jgi:hypothetical protein